MEEPVENNNNKIRRMKRVRMIGRMRTIGKMRRIGKVRKDERKCLRCHEGWGRGRVGGL